jgi:transmembrane protein EpsG
MAPLIFFIGLRNQGADTPAYIRSFDNCLTGTEGLQKVFDGSSKAVGFSLFMWFIKTFISQDFHVYLFVIAAISGTAVGYVLWKYSDHFALSMVLFILSGTYGWMINGIRQFMAASLGFLAIELLLQKKRLAYILFVLFLCTIHASAIILLAAVLFDVDKPFDYRILLVLIGTLIIIRYADVFVELLESSVESTVYDGITESFAADDGVNPLRVAVTAVPLLLWYWGKNAYKRKSIPVYDLSMIMTIMATAVYLVGVVTSGIIIGRLPIYFTLYSLILLPWETNELLEGDSKIMNVAMIAGYLAFFYLQGRMFYSSDVLGMYIPA